MSITGSAGRNKQQEFTFEASSPRRTAQHRGCYTFDPLHIPNVIKVTETSNRLLQTEVRMMVYIAAQAVQPMMQYRILIASQQQEFLQDRTVE